MNILTDTEQNKLNSFIIALVVFTAGFTTVATYSWLKTSPTFALIFTGTSIFVIVGFQHQMRKLWLLSTMHILKFVRIDTPAYINNVIATKDRLQKSWLYQDRGIHVPLEGIQIDIAKDTYAALVTPSDYVFLKVGPDDKVFSKEGTPIEVDDHDEYFVKATPVIVIFYGSDNILQIRPKTGFPCSAEIDRHSYKTW